MGYNKKVLRAIDRELKDRHRSKRYSKSLSATNSLFAPNYLFSKPSKRRIYNPNAKYFKNGGPHDPPNYYNTLGKNLTVEKSDPNYKYKDYAKRYNVDIDNLSLEDIESLMTNQQQIQDYWKNQTEYNRTTHPTYWDRRATEEGGNPAKFNEYVKKLSKYHTIPGDIKSLGSSGWEDIVYEGDLDKRRDDYPIDLQNFILDNASNNVSYVPQLDTTHGRIDTKQNYDEFPLVRLDDRFPNIQGKSYYQNNPTIKPEDGKLCKYCPDVSIPQYDVKMLERLWQQKILDDFSYEEVWGDEGPPQETVYAGKTKKLRGPGTYSWSGRNKSGRKKKQKRCNPKDPKCNQYKQRADNRLKHGGPHDPLPKEYLKSQGFADATNQDLDSLLRGFNTDGYDSHWYKGKAEGYGVTANQLRGFASENHPKSFVNAAAYAQAMNKLSNEAGGRNVSNIPFAQNAMVMRTSADDLPVKEEYVAPQTLQEQGYINETGTNAVNQDKSYSTGLAKRYGRGMYDHLVEKQHGGPVVKQRRGVRENSDGSVSSHLMRAEYIPEKGWVGFPSLFQDSKPYADDQQNWVDMSEEEDWMKIYEEAERRGEVYEFGEDKEAALAFGMGSWKDQLPEREPEEELYNMKRAKELGYERDSSGHLPSVDEETGMFLKSMDHPTAFKEYMYGQLNNDIGSNTRVVVNPEGHFGDKQLQYVELTDEEADKYRTGGYVLEEMHEGGEPGHTHKNPAQWWRDVPGTPSKRTKEQIKLDKDLEESVVVNRAYINYLDGDLSKKEYEDIKFGYTPHGQDRKSAYTKGVSEKLLRNITPQGYGDLKKNLDRYKRYQNDLGRNKDDLLWYSAAQSKTGKPIHYKIPKREDMFSLYLGLSQKNNSFSPQSEYKPANAKDPNALYWKPNYWTEEGKKELVEDYLTGYLMGDNSNLANERTTVFEPILDTLSVPWENPKTAEWVLDNPLGDFTVSQGKDDKGHYISIYDIIDFDPLKGSGKGASVNKNAASLLNYLTNKGHNVNENTEASSVLGAGKPYEIYDRIYYNPDDYKKQGGPHNEGYIEAKLTDEEVEQYKAGGYVLEEMHEGGEPGHDHKDPPSYVGLKKFTKSNERRNQRRNKRIERRNRRNNKNYEEGNDWSGVTSEIIQPGEEMFDITSNPSPQALIEGFPECPPFHVYNTTLKKCVPMTEQEKADYGLKYMQDYTNSPQHKIMLRNSIKKDLPNATEEEIEFYTNDITALRRKLIQNPKVNIESVGENTPVGSTSTFNFTSPLYIQSGLNNLDALNDPSYNNADGTFSKTATFYTLNKDGEHSYVYPHEFSHQSKAGKFLIPRSDKKLIEKYSPKDNFRKIPDAGLAERDDIKNQVLNSDEFKKEFERMNNKHLAQGRSYGHDWKPLEIDDQMALDYIAGINRFDDMKRTPALEELFKKYKATHVNANKAEYTSDGSLSNMYNIHKNLYENDFDKFLSSTKIGLNVKDGKLDNTIPYDEFLDKHVKPEAFYKGFKNSLMSRYAYLSMDAEVGAKLDAIRMYGKAAGIYDPMTEPLTKEKFIELKDFWMKQNPKSKDANQFRQMLEIMDEEELFELLNTMSKNEETSDVLDVQYAKHGGAIGLGDEVDKATMQRLKKQGYTFQEI